MKNIVKSELRKEKRMRENFDGSQDEVDVYVDTVTYTEEVEYTLDYLESRLVQLENNIKNDRKEKKDIEDKIALLTKV